METRKIMAVFLFPVTLAIFCGITASAEPMIRSIPGVPAIDSSLRQDIQRTRQQQTRSINKWGTHISNTAVALFLNYPAAFAPGNKNGQEIAYELSMQLLSQLAIKKKIPTNDLSVFINALTVTCTDPKDFFGINLVNELRQRIRNSNHTSPFALLTLCNAKGTMTTDDVQRLQHQYASQFRPVWTDVQAMVVMALSCISSRSDMNFDKGILDDMVLELKKKQDKSGKIDNLRTTALVVQALLAAENYQTGFDLNAAIHFILQEVRRSHPSKQDIYYILPIFNSKSLASINSDHCISPSKTDLEVISNLRENSEERIQVQISVTVQDNMDFSRTWRVKVPSNCSFYQVLENIGTLEPSYKVQYGVSGGKPYVISVAKFRDDSEKGFFWFIYTKPLSSTESPILIEQSPVDIQVKETDELILWYRSATWANAPDDSSG